MHNPGATTDLRKLSDEELIYRYAQRGEHMAVNSLFERYGHLIYGVCLKYLKNTDAAKDAMQQIFIKLLEDLKRFDIERFKPWLYQVAKNYCFMQLRRSVKVVNNEIVQDEHVEFEDGWHQKIEQEELLNALEKAVDSLNKEQKQCIEMFYMQSMSYQQIAAQNGTTIKQVKSAIQNGRRNLKMKLNASGTDKS